MHGCEKHLLDGKYLRSELFYHHQQRGHHVEFIAPQPLKAPTARSCPQIYFCELCNDGHYWDEDCDHEERSCSPPPMINRMKASLQTHEDDEWVERPSCRPQEKENYEQHLIYSKTSSVHKPPRHSNNHSIKTTKRRLVTLKMNSNY